MLDWLVIWGATQAVGFVFKPILEELAIDATKDWVKDLFKDNISKVVRLPSKEPLDKAAGQALKEFLQLVQEELEIVDVEEEELKEYIKPLKQFFQDKSVRETLGEAFQPGCLGINTQALVTIWNQLDLLTLPDEFNWERVSKLYLKKVKAIVRESDDLRQIFDFINNEDNTNNIREITGIAPDFDLIKYRDGIQEKYGNLKLDSLDTSGCAYNELKLWRMFVPQNVRQVHQVLPQIHEIPKEHQKQLRETNQLESELSPAELENYKQAFYRQSPQWVFEIWNDRVWNDGETNQYVVILGDPGSGKSTLLQYIALEWAELPIKDLSLLPIPLLIELRTYIRNRESNLCRNFLEFLHQGTGIICHLNQQQLHERLKAGNAVVMFDGLDEVFEPGKREDVITDIHRFTNDYPQVRAIVTSRVIGYKPQRLKDAGFSHFMLQDLEQYQIDDFIHRWHELTFNDEAEKIRKRDRLKAAIETSSAIRELAGNPLLLTMMAILNRNQELPRDRPELYNQASRVLLHQWDVERALIEDPRLDPKTIDYRDKQAMLRQVAYYLQANEQGLNANLIASKNLEDILANYLKTIEIAEAKLVARLMINQLRIRNFILCFMGADYYAFVHRTFLEYFCAWEFVWQFKEEQSLSIEKLKNKVFGQHWQDESWHEVLRLIAGMIQPTFVGDIIKFLMKQNGNNREFLNLFLAASLLAEARNPAIISEISDKLLDKFQELIANGKTVEVGVKAVDTISNTWKNNSRVLLFLKKLAQSRTFELVRNEAVLALGRNAKESEAALCYLQNLAQSGNEIAITELVQIAGDAPETLAIIQNLVESGNETAIAELIKIAGDAAETLPILKKIVQSSGNNDLKITAFKALFRYWTDDAYTILIIKSIARFCEGITIQELERNWQDDGEVLLIFLTIAQLGDEAAEKFAKKEIKMSHFSRLRTKITDLELLDKVLRSFGITVKTDADVRGFNGQTVRADIVAVLEGNFDLGWIANSERNLGTFDLIADLWGVSQKYSQTELINSINQRYQEISKGYARFN